jgi:hypothetical protein
MFYSLKKSKRKIDQFLKKKGKNLIAFVCQKNMGILFPKKTLMLGKLYFAVKHHLGEKITPNHVFV